MVNLQRIKTTRRASDGKYLVYIKYENSKMLMLRQLTKTLLGYSVVFVVAVYPTPINSPNQ